MSEENTNNEQENRNTEGQVADTQKKVAAEESDTQEDDSPPASEDNQPQSSTEKSAENVSDDTQEDAGEDNLMDSLKEAGVAEDVVTYLEESTQTVEQLEAECERLTQENTKLASRVEELERQKPEQREVDTRQTKEASYSPDPEVIRSITGRLKKAFDMSDPQVKKFEETLRGDAEFGLSILDKLLKTSMARSTGQGIKLSTEESGPDFFDKAASRYDVNPDDEKLDEVIQGGAN